MASVVSSTKISDRAQSNGSRYVRVKFVCADHADAQIDRFVGPWLVASDFDVDVWKAAYEDDILEELALEEDRGVLDTENVSNPLTYALNPLWSTTKRIGKVAIYRMMDDRDPRFVIYLEPLINYLRDDSGWTNQQIANFLDITLTKLQRMNDRVNEVLTNTGTMKALIADFDAVEDGF